MKTKSNIWIKNISILLIYLTATFFVSAEKSDIESDIKAVPLALQGYDVISYHLGDVALKGSNTFQATFKGKRYLFSSEENQKLFADGPEEYLPEFGGYCAHSASQQQLVAGDPSIYVVEQGNLYFFNDNTAKNIWDSKADDNKLVEANKYWKYKAKNIKDDLKAKNLWKEKATVTLFKF